MTKTKTKTNDETAKDADTTPYVFLVDKDKYVLTTPSGAGISDRTEDFQFHNFAKNYYLQSALNLGSAVFMKPVYNPPEEERAVEDVACFLAAFADNPAEQEKRRDYLVNNGIVRLLVTDESLLEELKQNQFYRNKR